MIHWRTIAWIGIGYCLIPLVLMLLWAPESPAWLVSKGKNEKALKAYKFLARAETEVSFFNFYVCLCDKEKR